MLSEIETLKEELASRDELIAEYEQRLNDPEAKARWESPDGKRVLHDLQDALNLVREYQHGLFVLGGPDQHWDKACALMSKWGMAPYPQVDARYSRAVGGFGNRFSEEEHEWADELMKGGPDAVERVQVIAERTEHGDVVRLVPMDKQPVIEGTVVEPEPKQLVENTDDATLTSDE